MITAIEFALHPADDALRRQHRVPDLRRHRRRRRPASTSAPTTRVLGLDVGLARFPDMPQLPEPLRGQTIASVAFVHIGDAESAAPIVERLRCRRHSTARRAHLVHDRRPRCGGRGADGSDADDRLGRNRRRRSIARRRRNSSARSSPESTADSAASACRVLGGRHRGRSRARRRGVGAISAPALISSGVLAFTPEMAAGADAALAAAAATSRPPTPRPAWCRRFLGSGTGLADAFDAATLDRLRAVKDRVDPQRTHPKQSRPLAGLADVRSLSAVRRSRAPQRPAGRRRPRRRPGASRRRRARRRSPSCASGA